MADRRTQAQDARLEAAAAWRVRLSEQGPAAEAGLAQWLAEDPRNGEAWRAAEALWADLGAMATEPELLRARRDALDRARQASRARWRAGRAPRRAVGAAAAAILLGCGLGYAAWRSAEPTHYATALGERRVVRLADGSVVTLDSATRLDVRLGRDARRLWLRQGQARFDVAHDVTRPFEVAAKNRTVVATGTSFNVEVLGSRVLVTLIEGRVTVRRTASHAAAWPQAPGAEVALLPGQRLVDETAAATPPRVEAADVERATAWESGKLIFDDEPLSSVAGQVSRYTERPVVVTDPRAGALRVSGVFSVGDLATFVDTVTRYLPVVAQPQPEGGVALRSKSGS